MKKWEYKKISRFWSSGLDISELKELGENGWELCGVTQENRETHIFYFKREIHE